MSTGVPLRIITFAGLATIAAVIALTLSRSPLVVTQTNGVAPRMIFDTRGQASFCQEDQVLPQGTTAVRLSLSVNIGPSVTVRMMSGSHLITEGHLGPGWGVTSTATVPVKPVARTVRAITACVRLGPAVETVEIEGDTVEQPASPVQGPHTVDEMRIEYMQPGGGSWWSRASTVARHMGWGHEPGGPWPVWVLIALMLLTVAITCWTVLKSGRSHTGAPAPHRGIEVSPSPAVRRRAAEVLVRLRRVPSAGWAATAVACLSAACWSSITPPFQVPDEPAHFAYVQQLAENAALPSSATSLYSPEEKLMLSDLHHLQVRWHPQIHAISTASEQQSLERDLARPSIRHGPGGAGVATAEPPLYYLLQTIPYEIGSGGNILDRLELMRLLSALLGGLTALFAYLFVREALPGAPWAWAVGGLGVALTPLLGFTSGGVTPDAMLCTVAAVAFYCLARGFRRGLTPRLAATIGAVTAVGLLTKLNFLGLAPGLLLGLVMLAQRMSGSRAAALRCLGLGVVIALSPAAVYMGVNLSSGHPALGLLSSGLGQTGQQGGLLKEIPYIWQLYLPRLPGMTSYFPGLSTTRDIWFDRSVGLYGWLDTTFPAWVDNVALIPVGLIVLLCLRSLLAGRVALRRRGSELLVYAVMAIGVMVLIGSDSYLGVTSRSHAAGGYAEPRYLLPLLPLLGALLVLGARGAGRRYGPAVGALVVLLVLGHDVLSQLQVISRYYS